MSAAAGKVGGVVKARITTTLQSAFSPVFLDVVDESYKHAVPVGTESHFKITVVSERFEGVKLLERHRLVNDALASEFAAGLHALSISAKAPSQWSDASKVHTTPPCLGGSKA